METWTQICEKLVSDKYARLLSTNQEALASLEDASSQEYVTKLNLLKNQLEADKRALLVEKTLELLTQ